MSSNKPSSQRHASSGSVGGGGGHHNTNSNHHHYPTSQLSYQETLIEEEPSPSSHHHNRSYSSNQHHSTIQSGYVLNQDPSGGKDPKRHSLLLSNPPHITDGIGWCGYILLFLSYALIFFTVPFSLTICLKVVQEYERAVMFRLGRSLPGGAKGPGMFFIVPCIDSYTKVDLRTVTFDVPPQEILTRDSVTVAVDAVVYFRIFDPITSVTNVEDAPKSTQLLAATTLRNVLGTRTLQEILSDRESIAHSMQTSLDDCTDSWGVRVERVEVKDVRLPVQLQRAMAAEAEAAREARAKVIAAEGEHKASRALKEAAEVINESPIALQLRYLQTLTAIASERNSTIVFPIPIELLHSLPLSSGHNGSHYSNSKREKQRDAIDTKQ